MNTEELIKDVINNKEKIELANWYAGEGLKILEATDGGRLMFTWEALYRDGVIFRQYDDITFFRALVDSSFIPSIDRIVSTDKIDRSLVKEFVLIPIAYTKSKCPWMNKPVRVVVNFAKGENLIANWCTDVNMTTGKVIRRHVVGIEKEGRKLLFVISPSGTMVLATNDDVSFEGE